MEGTLETAFIKGYKVMFFGKEYHLKTLFTIPMYHIDPNTLSLNALAISYRKLLGDNTKVNYITDTETSEEEVMISVIDRIIMRRNILESTAKLDEVLDRIKDITDPEKIKEVKH